MGGKPRTQPRYLASQSEPASYNIAVVGADVERDAMFMASVLDTMPALVLRVDPDFKIRYINRLREGSSLDQVLGASAWEFVVPEHLEEIQRVYHRVQETGEPGSVVVEAVFNNELAVYETCIAAVPEEDGRRGFCVVTHDVTSHVQRARELQQSKERLRFTLEATNIGLWSWDLGTGKVEWSERLYEITGHSEPLDFVQWVAQLVHPQDRDTVMRSRAEIDSTGLIPPSSHRIVRPDGSERWVLTTGTVVRDEHTGEIKSMNGGILDVTDQRRLEEQLQRAQRMETVGNLTAGIAHNFNNMLMVIQPCLDMLHSTVPGPAKEWASYALTASERAAEVVAQLMSFSGQGRTGERSPFRVSRICDETLGICERTFDRHVAITSEIETDAMVFCLAGDLQQVLMNILLNAKDAMLGSGVAEPHIHVRAFDEPRSSGRWVTVSVRDSGPGIDKALLEQIFDPFFTTKKGKGTGLGLSSSKNIVEGLGGQMSCRSRLGEGSTFSFSLPAYQGVDTEDEPAPSALHQRGRILIVDDEVAVRVVVKRLLETRGLECVAASGVAEARSVLAEGAVFDLVLLDRSMPDARGVELVPELRAALPAAKILFFTGHDVSPEEAALVDGLVHKPVREVPLIKAIASVLPDRTT